MVPFMNIECESFPEWNSPDFYALCETHLDNSIDSGNFFVTGYVLLIRMDSFAHMHGLFSLSITFFLFLHGFWCYII